MKYKIKIQEMLFHKIKNSGRKIDIRLLDKQAQRLKIHDIIEYTTDDTSETILREIKGIGIFDNIYDMANIIMPQMFGYDNPEEIIVRFNRLHSKEKQNEFNILALFIGELPSLFNDSGRLAKER